MLLPIRESCSQGRVGHGVLLHVVPALIAALMFAQGCRISQPSPRRPYPSLKNVPYRPLSLLIPRPGAWDAPGDPDLAKLQVRQAAPGDGAGESGGQRLHLVRRGESLSQLAQKYYGDAKKWSRIYDANRDNLASPNRLVPGALLVIPPAQ